MTTQFLILRMQGILDGKADLSAAGLRAIASEYKRLCEDVERRLVHCASLIKAGRDHIALQIAETSPQLLESINELVFSELDNWRSYCISNNMPFPPEFDAYQVELVKSLYTREISQNHPLYRDYRRAMRMHKDEEALAIMRTIAKVNYTNASVKQECERLKKRIVMQKFERAKIAFEAGKTQEALEIAKEIRDDAEEYLRSDAVWRKLSEKISAFETENARARVSAIIQEMRTMPDKNKFQQILALGAELDVLSSKYAIIVSESDSNFAKEEMRRASVLQDEVLAQEEKANANRELIAELANPDKSNPFALLAKLQNLKKKAGDIVDSENKKKLVILTASLRVKIMGIRLRRAVVCLLVCGALGYGGFMAYQSFSAGERLAAAKIDFSVLTKTTNFKKLSEDLNEFLAKYPDFVESPYFATEIAKLKQNIADKTFYEKSIEEGLAEIEKFDVASDSGALWSETLKLIDRLKDDAQNFEGSYKAMILEKIENKSRFIIAAKEKKREEMSARLNAGLTALDKETQKVDYFSGNFEEYSKSVNEKLQKMAAIVEGDNNLYTPQAVELEHFTSLQAKIQQQDEDYKKIQTIYEEMLHPRDFDAFFNALESLSTMKIVSSQYAKMMDFVLSKKSLLHSSMYGGFVAPEVAAKCPDEFAPKALDFTGEETVLKTFKNSDGEREVYSSGRIEIKRQSWKGGSEVIQDVAVINQSGLITPTTYRLHTSEGLKPRGAILKEGSITTESLIAREISQECMRTSQLKALNSLAVSDCNPVFKVWLERKILDSMRADPVNTGFAFSPSLQKRAKLVDEFTKDIAYFSWMFASPSRMNFIKTELYSKKLPDYFAEANEIKQKALEAYKMPLLITGYVAASGNFVLDGEPSEVMGLNVKGDFEAVTESTAAKFTPLFKKQ